MSPTTHGTWVITEGRDYTALVGDLNSRLSGHQLVVTEIDTVEFPDRTGRTGWQRLAEPAYLAPGNVHIPERIIIPVGLGITIPLRPTVHDGHIVNPIIDVNGDHVQILCPYLFHSPPRQIDCRSWSITAVKWTDNT